MARRPADPFSSFNFLLEIEGVTEAGFSECTGLNAEQNVIDYREGKDDLSVRKLPGLNKFGNITLKHGITIDRKLFDWHKAVMDGDIARANVSIRLLDEKREEKLRWNLRNAWPSKWTAPDLKANANEVAVEAVEITHEGVERA